MTRIRSRIRIRIRIGIGIRQWQRPRVRLVNGRVMGVRAVGLANRAAASLRRRKWPLTVMAGPVGTALWGATLTGNALTLGVSVPGCEGSGVAKALC